MSDREQSDHWKFLAADLGASPAPEEENKAEEAETPQTDLKPEVAEEPLSEPPAQDLNQESEEDKPVETPPKRQSGRTGDRVVSGFGYRRGAVDWANLARELGVEALEQAPEPIPASESDQALVAGPLTTDLTALGEREPTAETERVEPQSREDRSSTRRAKRATRPTGKAFGAGILDEFEVEAATPQDQDETADTDDLQEERKGRRRRRRRKPRKQDQDAEPIETLELEETPQTEVPSSATDEPDESKSRRRGRRRGGRKKTPREHRESQTEEFASGLEPVESGSERPGDFEFIESDLLQKPEIDEDESVSSKKPERERSKDKDREPKRKKKVTHRGIPSWDEAIGYIIDSNMEGRSKRPEPSGSRYRPGRRRGGDRSGNRG